MSHLDTTIFNLLDAAAASVKLIFRPWHQRFTRTRRAIIWSVRVSESHSLLSECEADVSGEKTGREGNERWLGRGSNLVWLCLWSWKTDMCAYTRKHTHTHVHDPCVTEHLQPGVTGLQPNKGKNLQLACVCVCDRLGCDHQVQTVNYRKIWVICGNLLLSWIYWCSNNVI